MEDYERVNLMDQMYLGEQQEIVEDAINECPIGKVTSRQLTKKKDNYGKDNATSLYKPDKKGV